MGAVKSIRSVTPKFQAPEKHTPPLPFGRPTKKRFRFSRIRYRGIRLALSLIDRCIETAESTHTALLLVRIRWAVETSAPPSLRIKRTREAEVIYAKENSSWSISDGGL